MQGRRKREIPKKTRRPEASCDNPEVTASGIEPDSPWCGKRVSSRKVGRHQGDSAGMEAASGPMQLGGMIPLWFPITFRGMDEMKRDENGAVPKRKGVLKRAETRSARFPLAKIPETLVLVPAPGAGNLPAIGGPGPGQVKVCFPGEKKDPRKQDFRSPLVSSAATRGGERGRSQTPVVLNLGSADHQLSANSNLTRGHATVRTVAPPPPATTNLARVPAGSLRVLSEFSRFHLYNKKYLVIPLKIKPWHINEKFNMADEIKPGLVNLFGTRAYLEPEILAKGKLSRLLQALVQGGARGPCPSGGARCPVRFIEQLLSPPPHPWSYRTHTHRGVDGRYKTFQCSLDIGLAGRVAKTHRPTQGRLLFRVVSSAFDACSAMLQHVAEHIIQDGRPVLYGVECCKKHGLEFFSGVHRSVVQQCFYVAPKGRNPKALSQSSEVARQWDLLLCVKWGSAKQPSTYTCNARIWVNGQEDEAREENIPGKPSLIGGTSGIAITPCERNLQKPPSPDSKWGRKYLKCARYKPTKHWERLLLSSGQRTKNTWRWACPAVVNRLLESTSGNMNKVETFQLDSNSNGMRKVSMVRYQNAWTEGRGDGRYSRKPPYQRHHPTRFLLAKIRIRPRPGVEPGSPWWEASSLTAVPPRPPNLAGAGIILEKLAGLFPPGTSPASLFQALRGRNHGSGGLAAMDRKRAGEANEIYCPHAEGRDDSTARRFRALHVAVRAHLIHGKYSLYRSRVFRSRTRKRAPVLVSETAALKCCQSDTRQWSALTIYFPLLPSFFAIPAARGNQHSHSQCTQVYSFTTINLHVGPRRPTRNGWPSKKKADTRNCDSPVLSGARIRLAPLVVVIFRRQDPVPLPTPIPGIWVSLSRLLEMSPRPTGFTLRGNFLRERFPFAVYVASAFKPTLYSHKLRCVKRQNVFCNIVSGGTTQDNREKWLPASSVHAEFQTTKQLSHHDRTKFPRISLLASHQGEPGLLIPDRVTPGSLHVGIVLDDAASQRGFIEDIPFPPALSFRRCSIHASITISGLQKLTPTQQQSTPCLLLPPQVCGGKIYWKLVAGRVREGELRAQLDAALMPSCTNIFTDPSSKPESNLILVPPVRHQYRLPLAGPCRMRKRLHLGSEVKRSGWLLTTASWESMRRSEVEAHHIDLSRWKMSLLLPAYDLKGTVIHQSPAKLVTMEGKIPLRKPADWRHRPAGFPTCEHLRVAPPGIELCMPCWEASVPAISSTTDPSPSWERNINPCWERNNLSWVEYLSSPSCNRAKPVQRHDGNTARLSRRSDEALSVHVSVARIAPSLLDLGLAGPSHS
ncbi:hypothetical protein PR048_024051 [Dryococelus australis]|uniref:Uncharacterized protein n=1 Tax=Dryococelus australis TaxID=614101 RepID=A0ABQ9GVV6_9NEOP|nr:hypothetical protein PR048_024051 [Dryococelus australis]